VIHIDFETRSKCELKTAGAWMYSKHPSTFPLCLAYAKDNGPVHQWLPGEPLPKDLRKWIFDREIMEAHNNFFEKAIWENVMIPQFGWPIILHDQWTCTAALAATHALPRKLEKVGLALNLPHKKNMDGHRTMLKVSKPRKPTKKDKSIWCNKPEDIRKMLDYNIDDVKAQRAIEQYLRPLHPRDKKSWQLDQTINWRGIRIDVPAVEAAVKLVEEYAKILNMELEVLTNGEVETASQVIKLRTWLRDQGCILQGLAKDIVAEALEFKELTPEARRALEIRKDIGLISVKKYKKMLDAVDHDDGRLRDLLMWCGASTWRWTGKGVQPHNLRKHRMKKDESFEDFTDRIETTINVLLKKDINTFEMCYNDVYETLSNITRAMFIPSEGKEFFGGDFNAIEARVIFWLAGELRGLEMFRQGQDIYKDLAQTIYDVGSIDDITAEQRDLGKRGVLGCGYQMGWKTFIKTCKDQGNLVIDAETSKLVVNTYREKYAPVKMLWDEMEKAAIYCVTSKTDVSCADGKILFGIRGRFLYMRVPSGRVLAYCDPKIKAVKAPWGEMKQALTYMAVHPKTRQWVEESTYGGKLAENATQSIARDLIDEAAQRCEHDGYEVNLSVHDELLTEHANGFVGRLEDLMCQPPVWGPDIPIKVKGWKGLRYLK